MKTVPTGALAIFFLVRCAFAQQAPWGRPDVPISSQDRVYAADQTSNTVSVIDPSANKLLGVIRLGDPVPGALSALYKGQLLVHGLGYSPDSKTLAVVSIASNGPGMTMFGPDGRYGFVCSSFTPELAVIDTKSHQIIKRVAQASPFCPNIASRRPEAQPLNNLSNAICL